MGKTIDFEWYKVFYEVALRGSVSGAAADLAVSQPAVSQSIRNLEQAFGVRLFHRRSRGVELTDTGRKLYSYVRESYRLLKLGERTVRELLEIAAGSLLIGAPDDLGTYLLTPLFKEFRRRHPDISLHMQTASSADIVGDIAAGRLEAGFITLPVETGGLMVLPLMELEDLFMAGSSYERLRNRKLTAEDLLQHPLALPVGGTSSRRNVDTWLKAPEGWAPAFEASSPEGIRRFTEAGLGIGYLLREAVSGGEANDELFILDVEPLPVRRRGAFVYRTDIPQSAAVRSMYELVFSFFKD